MEEQLAKFIKENCKDTEALAKIEKFVKTEKTMEFVLCSNSDIKKRVTRQILHENDMEMIELPKEVKIKTSMEQPMSKEDAENCIRERIEQTRKIYPDKNIIAIENYIVGEAKSYIDHCMVVVETKVNRYQVIGNLKARCPKFLLKFDPKKKTLGKALQEKLKKRMKEHSPDNWFKVFPNKNKFDRFEQITEALNLLVSRWKLKMKVYSDFPKEGVNFHDLFSQTSRANGTRKLVDILELSVRSNVIESDVFIVGLESRGLSLGMCLADRLGLSFVPLRKPGKLPGRTVTKDYTTEYSKDTFEMQLEYLDQVGKNAVIIDDLLATGGSMKCAVELLQENDKEIKGIFVLKDIPMLRDSWKSKLNNLPVYLCDLE